MKKAFFLIPLILTSVLILITKSCTYHNEEELYPTTTTTTCDTTNAQFAAFISPLIRSTCAISGCHTAASAPVSAGVNLSSYTTIKSYITSSKTAFLGSIKHDPRFSTMPKSAPKLSDCNIKKIEVWINAGLLNN